MGIQITKEKSWYSAYLPEYRIHTQGENFEELISNLKEAVSLYFSKESQEVPVNLSHLINYKTSHTFNMVIS